MINFLKWAVGILALIMGVVIIFALVVDAGDRYKSFAELHPYLSQQNDMPEFDIIKIKGGIQYTVLAEGKKLNHEAWYQIIDATGQGEELDGRPDYIALFYRDEVGFLQWRNINYGRGMWLIEDYCKANGIDINDFLHYAKDSLENTI